MRISGSYSACSGISANRALRVKPGHRDYKADEALMLQDGQKTALVRQETKILHSAFNKVQNTLEFYQRDEGKIATWLPYEEYSDCTWFKVFKRLWLQSWSAKTLCYINTAMAAATWRFQPSSWYQMFSKSMLNEWNCYRLVARLRCSAFTSLKCCLWCCSLLRANTLLKF